jgi:hypothetical protein
MNAVRSCGGFTTTLLHFGGCRVWMICPRCSGRVPVMFAGRGKIGCRRCLRVRYRSKCADAQDRAHLAIAKIEQCLITRRGRFLPLQDERGLVHPRGTVDLCNQPRSCALCGREHDIVLGYDPDRCSIKVPISCSLARPAETSRILRDECRELSPQGTAQEIVGHVIHPRLSLGTRAAPVLASQMRRRELLPPARVGP